MEGQTGVAETGVPEQAEIELLGVADIARLRAPGSNQNVVVADPAATEVVARQDKGTDVILGKWLGNDPVAELVVAPIGIAEVGPALAVDHHQPEDIP